MRRGSDRPAAQKCPFRKERKDADPHGAPQNDLIVINIVNEDIERMNALPKTALDYSPFIRSDDSGNDVEWKDPLGARLIAINVESDANAEQRLLGRLLIEPEFSVIERGDSLKQQTRARSRHAIRFEHLVVKTTRSVSVKKHKKSALGKTLGRHCRQ